MKKTVSFSTGAARLTRALGACAAALGAWVLVTIAGAPCASAQGTSVGDVDVVTLSSRSRAYRPGEVIVKFKESAGVSVRRNAAGRFLSAGRSSIDTVLASIGVAGIEQLMPLTGSKAAPRKVRSLHGDEVALADLSQLYVVRLEAERADAVYQAVQQLQQLGEVEYAEPNYLVYTLATGDSAKYAADPLYSQQYGLQAINLPRLWEQPSISTKRPVIAILDTGVDTEHPDLADNIWTNEGESTGAEGADDDGNGFIDDLHGWDFVNQSARVRDNNGHGTHCAGIAAASGGNGIGITGANPDALIMPVTVMQSDGTGDVATIIKGLDYAVANGASVISMSFGGYSYSIAEEQALARAYASAVLVAAAGNDGLCINPHDCKHPTTGMKTTKEENGPSYPAAFTFVFGVKASSSTGELASFSNYDCDGPSYFNPEYFSEEKMYNYELMAPGVNISSTYPDGTYRNLNGTSMACPLAAGAISRLLQCKEYSNKEQLFGDLINTLNGNIDVWAAYNVTDADRQPELSVVTYELNDSTGGDGDGRADAGETISLYPTLRNLWGQAKNIKVWLTLGENEDPEIVELPTEKTDFGKPLSSYAKEKSANPIVFTVNKDCVDGRHIKFTLNATCDNIAEELSYDFTITVENGVEIGGMIDKDMTLYPNVHYIVTKTLAIPDSVTLTIKPGTVLKFKGFNGGYSLVASKGAHIKAVGTPDSMIVFTKTDLGGSRIGNIYFECEDTLKYILIENLKIPQLRGYQFKDIRILNCDVPLPSSYHHPCGFSKIDVINCSGFDFGISGAANYGNSMNFINNIGYGYGYFSSCFLEGGCNAVGNNEEYNNRPFNGSFSSESVSVYTTDSPSYFGSAREDIVRKWFYDIESNNGGFGKFDLSNMLTRPNPEAHGIVWKVVVNGYDAQDEFEQLPPLGVGKHKFEVYYSKPVNKELTPTIAMGVRPPYTQTSIAEDGSWNEAGDVYTAYLTITGKMAIDGLNRIYVSGGEDQEHWEIPLENTRFNVSVSAAGSMSTGFTGEAGLGTVTLTWEQQDANVDDILGYNLYRYQQLTDSTVSDTVRINERLLTDTVYVDYDVVPGSTYCYYYKIMRTDLAENSPSSVVAVTPLTATKGDANGSMAVDLADVVTEINYMTGKNPQPFIFDAADVNSDLAINILDVVGTINIVLDPTSMQGVQAMGDATVTYSIQDGVLYLDSPVALGGVQLSLSAPAGTEITPAEALSGFETVKQWNGDECMFLAYSMSGKTIAAGRHAVLRLAGAKIGDIVLSDTRGRNVVAVSGDVSGIGTAVQMQMRAPYPNPFRDVVTIPYVIGKSGNHSVRMVFTDLAGRTVDSYEATRSYGEYTYTWRPDAAQRAGLYLVTLYVDGVQVQTSKLLQVK